MPHPALPGTSAVPSRTSPSTSAREGAVRPDGALAIFLLVVAIVGGAAALGLASRHAFSVAFWPVNAILVGILIRNPALHRPAGWAGAALGLVAADMAFGRTLELSGFFAAANVSGMLTAVVMLRRLDPRDLRLRRVHSVMRITASLIPACFVAAMMGAVLVVVEFHGSASQTLMTWAASEMANYLIALPMTLTIAPPWRGDRRATAAAAPTGRLPVWPALTLAISCTLAVVFDGPGSIMFPMPALLLCAMTYPVSVTAMLTMALGTGCMVTIGLGIVDIGQDLSIPRMVVSIRIAVAFLALVPLTISSAMAVRDDLMDQLRVAADHDGLTGLLNRRAFEQRLHDRLATPLPAGDGLVLLWLDIDHFKAINDVHGHPAGDAVLRAVAATLRDCCRSDDLSARLGGEEFALVIATPDRVAAAGIVERLRRALAAKVVDWNGTPIRATASIGACHVTRLPVDPADMVHRLDEAMYRAKRAGRDRVRWLEAA